MVGKPDPMKTARAKRKSGPALNSKQAAMELQAGQP
jgi:hypothetical protein